MSTIEAGRRSFGKHDGNRDGMSLEAMAAAPRRLDELSCARLVGNAADLVHAAQKAGQPLGTLNPAAIIVRADGSTTLVPSAPALAYTAPERLHGATGDRRADVFALGAVLWEALAHEPLFDGGDDDAIRRSVLERDIPAPSERNANVPGELDAICLKALARDPADRHASAKVLSAEIDAVLGDADYPESNERIAAYLARALAAPEPISSGAPSAPMFGHRTAPLPLPSVLPSPPGDSSSRTPAPADLSGALALPRTQTAPLGTKPSTQPMPAMAASPSQATVLDVQPLRDDLLVPPLADAPRTQTIPLGSPAVLIQPALGSQAVKPQAPHASLADLPRSQTIPLGSPAVLIQPALGSQAVKPAALPPDTEPSLAVPATPTPVPDTEPSMPALQRTGTAQMPAADRRPLASTAVLGSNALDTPVRAVVETPPPLPAVDTPPALPVVAPPPIHKAPDWDTLPSFGPPEMPTPATVVGVAPVAIVPGGLRTGAPLPKPRTPTAPMKPGLVDTHVGAPPAPVPLSAAPALAAPGGPLLSMPPGITVAPSSPPATLQTADNAFGDEHHSDPFQVVALHQAQNRAATSRDMLGGWGWSTGAMAVIEDPDHFDEVARASRRRLFLAIGGALVVAMIVAGAAFAFSGNKRPDAQATDTALPAASLTAPVAPTGSAQPPAPVAAAAAQPSEPTTTPPTEPTAKPATEPTAAIATEPTKPVDEPKAAPAPTPTDDKPTAPAKSAAVDGPGVSPAVSAAEGQRGLIEKPAPAKPAPAKPAPTKTAAIKRPEPKPQPARRTAPPKAVKPGARPVDPYATASKVDPATAYRTGIQQYARGDTSSALATFRSSVAANPSFAPNWRGLGLVYEKLGDRNQARSAFRRYLQLAPAAGDAAQIRDRLDRLGS